MEKVKDKKSKVDTYGKGEFSPSRNLLRFSYTSPSILLIDRDNMAYYINRDFFNKHLEKVKRNFNPNLVAKLRSEANKLRKDNNNNTYKRIRDALWTLFIKFDLDDSKDVETLKKYIFYHFIQTVTNEHEALYASYVVFTDWDDKIGIELFSNVYTLQSLNVDMFNAEVTNIH